MKLAATAAVAAIASPHLRGVGSVMASAPPIELSETTIAALQAALRSGATTSRALVEGYLGRIGSLDQSGPAIRSILEINPDAAALAEALDRER